jgi:predicted dehydrogenase
MTKAAEGQEPLRIGVAGLGFGASVHVPALRSLPGVDVVAIAGRDPHRTAEVAGRLDIEAACAGIDDLLAINLDAVTLALPPSMNETAATKALRRGLPVLSEKPLASSATAAESLAELARGCTTAIDFEFAELRTFRTMRDVIQQGEVGAVRLVDVTWLVDSWFHRSRTWSWKSDANEGGGVLALLAPHVMYLLEWLLGDMTAIAGRCDNRATESYAPHGASAAVNGVNIAGSVGAEDTIFSIALDNAAPGARIHRWTVVCERATLVAESTGSDWASGFVLDQLFGNDRRRLAEEIPFDGDGRLPPMRAVAERFVHAVRTGAECRPDFANGARVQRLIELASQTNPEPSPIPTIRNAGQGEAS